MLVEYVNGNYYAMFYNPSYHTYRETHFSILLDVEFRQSHWSVNCRSRVSFMVRACRVVKDNYYANYVS